MEGRKRVYIGGQIDSLDFHAVQRNREETCSALRSAGFESVDPLRRKKAGGSYQCREIVVRDKQDLKTCQILLVDLNGERPCGTLMEVALAHEWGLFVVAYAELKAWCRARFWTNYHVDKWFKTKAEAVSYLEEYWAEGEAT